MHLLHTCCMGCSDLVTARRQAAAAGEAVMASTGACMERLRLEGESEAESEICQSAGSIAKAPSTGKPEDISKSDIVEMDTCIISAGQDVAHAARCIQACASPAARGMAAMVRLLTVLEAEMHPIAQRYACT